VVNDVEMNRCDEQSTMDVDNSAATAKQPAKSDQSSTKPGSNRARNASNKKVWKPGGSLNATSIQQNRKEVVVGQASRAKPNRQGNAAARTDQPPKEEKK